MSNTATETQHNDHNHVAVRLDAATLARIAALQPHFSGPHAEATRSDVLRALLLVSLADAEKDPAQFAERLRATERG